MPRKKNYEVSDARREQARRSAAEEPCCTPSVDPEGARIDLVALLGLDSRFTRGERFLDLSSWLDHGIDSWVWAAVASLKSLLLSGGRETSTVTWYSSMFRHFFAYLTERDGMPKIMHPADFSPLHLERYIAWLQKRGQQSGWHEETTRACFRAAKSLLLEMLANKFIPGDRSRFFRRAQMPVAHEGSRQTSLSDAEQERLAIAIKRDLVAVHHGRLELNPAEVQGLRLLVVAHRQGLNLTPLLELRRDTMAAGAIPGTVRIRTKKYRNRKVRSGAGRAATVENAPENANEQDLVFDLSEGAVLQMAIKSTEVLLTHAPAWCKSRVWLYQGQGKGKWGAVTCLTDVTLRNAIKALIERHKLVGDDGEPLLVNLSRLRKAFYDRALRISDGNQAKTANLMGNTVYVAATHYTSMNESRKAEAADFMNKDYLEMMVADAGSRSMPRVIDVRPFKESPGGWPTARPRLTPVSACKDTLNGEYAPRDGNNHCDRFVMCIFCSSFAVVGTADELWRLFSFQAFAKAEIEYLDCVLGPERTGDEALEDLRDRYRLAIPYIDDFTRRQFPPRNVDEARRRTEAGVHPFWAHQMTVSSRARVWQSVSKQSFSIPSQKDNIGDRDGK